MAQTLKIGSKNLNTENWKVYHPSGHHMFTCGERKAQWYLDKGLAVLMEEEYSIKLVFEPKGYGFKEDEIFGLAGRELRCVVTGEAEGLQRHHIVPYCYRNHFPEEYKSKNHHDVVLVTYKIHEQYEQFANQYKDQIAQEYGVPTLNQFNLEYTKVLCEFSNKKIKLLSRLHSIFKNKGVMPNNVIYDILNDVSEYTKIPLEKLIVLNYVQLYKLYLLLKQRHNEEFDLFKEKNKLLYDHGFYVVSKLKTHKEIKEFVRKWRLHFVKTMKPKYMPIGWSVNFKVKVEL